MAVDFRNPLVLAKANVPIEIRSPDGMDAHVWIWIEAYERYEADGDAAIIRKYFSA
jgi:hypothetical protein